MKEPFFCFRSNFGAITRLETLATEASFSRVPRINGPVKLPLFTRKIEVSICI